MATQENGSPGIMSYNKIMNILMATPENGSPGIMSYNMYAPCKGNENKTIKDGGISPLTIKWGFNHQIPYKQI